MSRKVVHSEPFVSEDGVPYLIEVLKGRSGKLYGRYTAQEGQRAGQQITCQPGYKTVRGAVGNAKRLIAMDDDLDWDLEE